MAKFKNSKLEWRERRIRDSFTTERIVKNELVNKDITTLTTAINLKYKHDYSKARILSAWAQIFHSCQFLRAHVFS